MACELSSSVQFPLSTTPQHHPLTQSFQVLEGFSEQTQERKGLAWTEGPPRGSGTL